MSGYETLLALTGRLVAARYPQRGDEIVETARQAARDGYRWAELASLLGLALRSRPSARVVWLHGALMAAALAALTSVAPAVLVLPFGLLILGVFDARFAAAATLYWALRLVTSDLADPQILRWVAMLVGVLIAAHVTRRSIRRAAAI
jgi:hypothetical protein